MSIAHEHLAKAREDAEATYSGAAVTNHSIMHALISIAASLAGEEPAKPDPYAHRLDPLVTLADYTEEDDA